MSCKDFEERIYLYGELSATEKAQVDAHLQTCAACATMFESIKAAQLLIEEVAGEVVIPENAARLTSNIMSKIAIEGANRVSIFTEVLLGRTRIALAALSIILLVTFAVEFLQDSAQFRPTRSFDNNSSVLNSKLFRDNFSQGKVKHRLFADCSSPLNIGQRYLDCLRGKLK